MGGNNQRQRKHVQIVLASVLLMSFAPTAFGSGLASPTVGLLVQFHEGMMDDAVRQITAAGHTVTHTYTSVAAVALTVPVDARNDIAAIPGVKHVEEESPVEFLLATAKTSTRSPSVTDPVTGLKDGTKNVIDGRGVGVAVIDLGIDATHADLQHRLLTPNFAVTENLKVVSISPSQGLVPMVSTDQTSGHGTHVAGILAGRGKADPSMRGVAPGAVLFGLGVGEAATTLWTNQALDWVAVNHATANPRIRIVSNSWQTSTTYNPADLQNVIVTNLVNQGVVVVFAAGNGGGTGAASTTNGACQNPLEGVICVANFSDANTGTRDGTIVASSSRGATSTPSTWPDVSAPGEAIRSTIPPIGFVTGLGISPYAELSGTSMAAPHVSGVVALMLQADAALTPAQVESILEATAYNYADGGPYVSHADPRFNGSHVAKGHGLVDALAAVQQALL